MNVLDSLLGGGDTLLRGRVPIILRTEGGTIHADAANEGPLTTRVADIGKSVRRGDVDGSEVRRTGRAVGERSGDDGIVNLLRFGGIAI